MRYNHSDIKPGDETKFRRVSVEAMRGIMNVLASAAFKQVKSGEVPHGYYLAVDGGVGTIKAYMAPEKDQEIEVFCGPRTPEKDKEYLEDLAPGCGNPLCKGGCGNMEKYLANHAEFQEFVLGKNVEGLNHGCEFVISLYVLSRNPDEKQMEIIKSRFQTLSFEKDGPKLADLKNVEVKPVLMVLFGQHKNGEKAILVSYVNEVQTPYGKMMFGDLTDKFPDCLEMGWSPLIDDGEKTPGPDGVARTLMDALHNNCGIVPFKFPELN